MTDPALIRARLEEVRRRITVAETRTARAEGSATLIAVSKTHPLASVIVAQAAGQTVFGENRVQEASAKFPPPASRDGTELHLIGPLQTNKARDAVRIADVIHTLDRLRLADALADAIEREGRQPGLLVQVNTGDEPQKAGIGRAEADDFITVCQVRFDRLCAD